ncbi:MAG: M56 family metallopeptidase, partial [Bacteroidetes bacterium]|nr:M56 family metallopeptidase [Bacteroidota bacterium]
MMTLIADWLHMLGGAGLDVFWRPLLAWTLVFLPLYGALRLWRGAPALVQYHAHLALLLALPLSLALAPLVSWPAPEAAVFVDDVFPLPSLERDAVAAPEGGPVVAPAQGLVWGLAHWIGVLTLFAAGCAAFLLIRMLYLAYALRGFRRRLVPVEDPRTHRLLRALTEEMGVRDDVALLATPDDTTPMTFGWRRPVIVLPAALLDDEPALRLTLLHELIHIRRRDYAVSWVVRLVSGLFAIHPGVWLLHRRIDQYREISCDAETLGQTTEGAGAYARLLVRFSPLYDLAGPAALRMAKLDSTLKKRITAMHHTLRFTSSLRLRRWSLPLAALLLLIPALLAACATENTTTETVIVTAAPEDAEHQKFVHGEQLELAQQITDELTWREELERQENRRAFDEAVQQMRILETFKKMNQDKLVRL